MGSKSGSLNLSVPDPFSPSPTTEVWGVFEEFFLLVFMSSVRLSSEDRNETKGYPRLWTLKGYPTFYQFPVSGERSSRLQGGPNSFVSTVCDVCPSSGELPSRGRVAPGGHRPRSERETRFIRTRSMGFLPQSDR